MMTRGFLGFPEHTGIGMIAILNDNNSNISKSLRKLAKEPDKFNIENLRAVLSISLDQTTEAGLESKRIIGEVNLNAQTIENIKRFARNVFKPSSLG